MTFVGTFAQICRTPLFALGRELAAWKPSRARATFGTEAMLSVVLSVAPAVRDVVGRDYRLRCHADEICRVRRVRPITADGHGDRCRARHRSEPLDW
jgi:hypothetical protein